MSISLLLSTLIFTVLFPLFALVLFLFLELLGLTDVFRGAVCGVFFFTGACMFGCLLTARLACAKVSSPLKQRHNAGKITTNALIVCQYLISFFFITYVDFLYLFEADRRKKPGKRLAPYFHEKDLLAFRQYKVWNILYEINIDWTGCWLQI
jgi:hypothetical protein